MRTVYVKPCGYANHYKDGGTIEYKGWDGKNYFVDHRIGSTTKGLIYDRYPDDSAARLLNVKLVQTNFPPVVLEDQTPIVGFTRAPKPKQLALTPDEIAKLKQLILWLEASKLDQTIWNKQS